MLKYFVNFLPRNAPPILLLKNLKREVFLIDLFLSNDKFLAGVTDGIERFVILIGREKVNKGVKVKKAAEWLQTLEA